MDKLFAYLLLGLLLIVAWNESLSSRFHRLIRFEKASQETVVMEATPLPTPTPKRLPFWQDSNYRSPLEKKTIIGRPEAAKSREH